MSNILKRPENIHRFFCHIIHLKVQINPLFPAQKHSPAVMIYLLPRAFWCWWFWQHALGPCTAWHNVARLRRPPWRNRQRTKYTIELDVEPQKICSKPFKNGLKGHLCSLFVFHASKCFTVKKNNSYAHLPLQIRNEYNTQVFVWCANIHDIHMGTKCRTHSVFQKPHWVYFQKDLRYENHLRQSW